MPDGVRVLDLADGGGQLAAMILAGLGADVVAVEPPGGRSSRQLEPRATGVDDPEASLVHWANNRGKRQWLQMRWPGLTHCTPGSWQCRGRQRLPSWGPALVRFLPRPLRQNARWRPPFW